VTRLWKTEVKSQAKCDLLGAPCFQLRPPFFRSLNPVTPKNLPSTARREVKLHTKRDAEWSDHRRIANVPRPDPHGPTRAAQVLLLLFARAEKSRGSRKKARYTKSPKENDRGNVRNDSSAVGLAKILPIYQHASKRTVRWL
jgi:hypothetical protein